jgi:type II secretory pathway pseudopilin PulG
MMARFKQTDKRNANAAFTLVEIVMGAAVLGVTMVAFFGGITSGLYIVNTFRQDLLATQILTQKTEAVRLCTWSQLAALPATFQYLYKGSATNSSAGLTYYGTISVGHPTNVIPNSVSYYTNIDLITINLYWTNYFGLHSVAHKRQVQTLAAYYGLVNYTYGSGFIQQ